MINSTKFRVYNVTHGLAEATLEDEFDTRQMALIYISEQSNKTFYMIIECFPGEQ